MPKVSNTPKIPIEVSYEDARDSKFIIYGYFEHDILIYVGKDSNGHINRRYLNHSASGREEEQPINRILQNEKWSEFVEYRVLAICSSKMEMENLETMYIIFYKAFGQAKFNKVVDMPESTFEYFVKNLETIDLKLNSGLPPGRKKEK